MIGVAYDWLLDYHIDEPQPSPLLDAAWREVAAEARRLGADAAGLEPELDGDRASDWEAFRASFVALVEKAAPEAAPQLRYAALSGMARSLNDCHTFFLPPARSDALNDLRLGRGSVGVGIELAPVRPTYVREVATGGPAEVAGVRAGDRLLAVDGNDVTALDIEAINDRLRGESGSRVTITVRRPSDDRERTLVLTRALVRIPPVEAKVLPGGVGYIRVRTFTAGTQVRDLVDEAAVTFAAADVAAWVIDLRDNPGGDSDLQLAGRFVTGVAERTLLRGGNLEVLDAEGEPYPALPTAVLVNGGTASVAEIFAAMLQDYGRARVFGSATARCAGFVSLETLADSSTLGVTIGHSLTPLSARPLYRTGVVPDDSVRQTVDDLAAGRDPALERAVAWLRTQGRSIRPQRADGEAVSVGLSGPAASVTSSKLGEAFLVGP